jgi:5-methylcytosine-specific restriction enzyme subunit McrC
VAADALTVFEHGEIPVSTESSLSTLSADEASYLEELAIRVPRLCQRGHRTVRFGSFCGVTHVGSRTVEVLPKVDEHGPPEQCRGILLGLLQRSRSSVVFRQLAVSQRLRHASLLDVFIDAFFDEVSRLVRSGLLREYDTQEDDLRRVRGRIVVSRQFSVLANRRDVVSCQFDELTADNDWNRYIKVGLRAVRAWIGDIELDRRWVDLMIAFEEVADVPAQSASLLQLRPDRKAARYVPSAEWVRRILEVLSPSLRSGEASSPGLLFDVNRLWEDAVAAELVRIFYSSEVGVESQSTGQYLARIEGTDARVVGLRPDLLLTLGGRVAVVADTKWKRVETSRSGHALPAVGLDLPVALGTHRNR